MLKVFWLRKLQKGKHANSNTDIVNEAQIPIMEAKKIFQN